MKISRLFSVTLTIFFAICSPRVSNAADLTLQWDPPGDGVATGYVLYYGTGSNSYSQQVDVGDRTEYTVIGLQNGFTYYFALRAYDATGTTSDLSSEVNATVAPSPLVTEAALTASLSSPQMVGTSVTFLSTATGGIAPYEFEWAYSRGDTWNAWPFTASSTLTLTTLTAGDYQVTVAVRNSGSSSTGDVTRSMPFTFTATPPIVASVTLLANVASPQTAGGTILWSATASGGIAPYQYRWWVFDGKAWGAATAWTTSATWAWTPKTPREYIVRVWARSAGQSIDAAESSASVLFSIESPGNGPPEKCLGPKC